MNKKITKIVAVSAACLTALSTLGMAACNSGGIPDDVSVLNIRYYNGGLGDQWINQIKKNFEEMFANVSFEEGKQGVYVNVVADKQFTDIEQTVAIGADKNDIYYTPDTGARDHVSAGVTMDVTDIYTEKVYGADGNVKLNAAGDGYETQTVSLRDKAGEDAKDAFNFGSAEEPVYYAIPYADCLSGIIVDYDLFEEEGWNNYGGLHGLPETAEDFYDLLKRIQRGGYSGFTYSVGHYTPMITRSIVERVDGEEGTTLWTSYRGDYDFNNDGTITEDEKITPATAYKIIDTRGYKAAYEFVNTMFAKDVNGNTYYDPNVVQGVSYSGAQQDFLMSKNSDNRNRIAMIIEGEWWENEARGTFTSMGNIDEADAFGKRDFRFMPIPQMTDSDKGTKYTMGSHSGSGEVLFVNKKTVEGNAVKEKLCKLWLQYQYSTEGMKIFTKNSGSVLPYNYEMSEAELAELTPFQQSVWEMHTSDEIKIVHYKNTDEVELAPVGLNWNAKVGSTTYNSTHLFTNMLAMAQKGQNVSVADWIAGAHVYYDSAIANAFAE